METTITGNSKEALMTALGERYGRKKSCLYDWLKMLNITAVKRDGIYTFSTEDLAQLDRLNEWVASGNKALDFPEKPTVTAITPVENQAIQETAIPLETTANNDDFQQLIRSGQEKGAGLLIAQNLLAQQFAANPEMLPPDLLQQVRESEQAIAPKSKSPMEYANRFMSMATLPLAA